MGPPFAPGYNHQLDGGTACVPRRDGRTPRVLFDGNLASNPDAWALISWNEVVEGTYVEPLTAYGKRELDTVKSIVVNGS